MPKRKEVKEDQDDVEEQVHSDDSDVIERIELPPKPVPKRVKKNGGIHQFTLDFVKDLKDLTPDRNWFQINRPRYDAAKENFLELVTYVLKEMCKVDSDLIGLEPKSLLYRINRDIRFSLNKNPYKTSIGASLVKGGKRALYAHYYIHLEAGNNIIAAGIHEPAPELLAKIRAEIASNPERLKLCLADQQITEQLGVTGLDSLLDTTKKLKTCPKGYPKDHPEIELLKLKSFAIGSTVTDEQVLADDFPLTVVKHFTLFQPFVSWVNSVVE